MALTTYYVKYELDIGEEVNIKIRYDGNESERLSRGKLTALPDTACKWIMERRDLKPRYIDTIDFGRVYFKTHADWMEYLEDTNNHSNIRKACGECVNCRTLVLVSI